jgi:hypothetical protein
MRRLILLLTATVFLMTGAASAATPTDPRIAAAVAAWAKEPLYVDPDFTSVADRAETLQVISNTPMPVFVAVVPFGDWFPEKGDTTLLAGRMAAANGRPGLYVVMDGNRSYGVAHQLPAYAPSWTYADGDQTLSKQLSQYVDGVKQSTYRTPKPARTAPLPPEPERTYPPEKFTVGKAIGNGAGGTLLGLMGGAVLGGIVVIVVALIRPRRREGRA